MLSKTAKVMGDEDEFCGWLGNALPGERCVYHAGYLAIDIEPTVSTLDASEQKALKDLANRVMLASELGLVHPLQRREGRNDFTYLAVVARPSDTERHRLWLEAALSGTQAA